MIFCFAAKVLKKDISCKFYWCCRYCFCVFRVSIFK